MPARRRSQRTALYETAPADFHDAEVVREFAVSKDGTKVPINIIRRKGTKLDGNNPVVLYGYGGYGINLTPVFLAAAARCCSITASSTRSPTCAAAANTARPGTAPAC